jgi:hypothetical protein
MKRYLLPILIGFAGMFAAHILLLLLVVALSLEFMPYIISYPIVYGVLAFLLTRNNTGWWLSNVIYLLLIPFVYWYWLLWSDGKLGWPTTVNFNDSGGMMVILPVTFLIAFFISLGVYRNRISFKTSAFSSRTRNRNIFRINTKTFLVLKLLAVGMAAAAITFTVMMGTSPLVTSILTAILYFFLSIWIGRVQPQTLWYAPILINIAIWIIFIPMGMEIWPPKIQIWYFLIPPFVSLPAAYLGMFTGFRFVAGNTSRSNASGGHSNVIVNTGFQKDNHEK